MCASLIISGHFFFPFHPFYGNEEEENWGLSTRRALGFFYLFGSISREEDISMHGKQQLSCSRRSIDPIIRQLLAMAPPLAQFRRGPSSHCISSSIHVLCLLLLCHPPLCVCCLFWQKKELKLVRGQILKTSLRSRMSDILLAQSSHYHPSHFLVSITSLKKKTDYFDRQFFKGLM